MSIDCLLSSEILVSPLYTNLCSSEKVWQPPDRRGIVPAPAANGAAPDVTLVGVVHDLALAARFADQLVLIHEGAVLAAGPPGEVMTPEHVRAAFGVEPVSVSTPDGRRHLVFD
jgi:hypothetical protein